MRNKIVDTIGEKSQQPLEILLKQWGNRKKLPEGFELPALTALTYYPALRNIAIEYHFTKASIPVLTIVKPGSVHMPPDKRIYSTRISTEIKKEREDMLLKNLSFNRQVGMLAHELAHVQDYLSKSTLQIIFTAIRYPLKSFKQKLERSMDISTVRHGAGYQLLDVSRHVAQLKSRYPEDKYFKTYFDHYLTENEIIEEMKKTGSYSYENLHI